MIQDQTQFTQEEPLYQDVYSPQEEVEVEKKSWYKTRKGIVLIAGGLLVLFIVLAAVLAPRSKQNLTVVPSPSPEVAEVSVSGFDKRINDLEDELNRADPTDTVLPFPAVDMGIALEVIDD